MKKSILFAVALSLLPTVSAKTVTGNVEKSFVFSEGLKDSYKVSLDVPNNWEVKDIGDKMQIRKSFFEELELEVRSKVPQNIMFGGKGFQVKDEAAKSEVYLTENSNKHFYFELYRRLNDKGPILLECSGDSESQAVVNDMVKACRSAKLK